MVPNQATSISIVRVKAEQKAPLEIKYCPRSKVSAILSSSVIHGHAVVEQIEIVSHGNSLNTVDSSKLIKGAKVVNNVEHLSSLHRGDARYSNLQFPNAPSLGKELITRVARVPVLRTILELLIAELGGLE